MVRRFSQVLLVAALLVFPCGIARAQGPASSLDLGKLADEAQGWLTDLIKINTTNPPGNELAAAKYIAAILQREGIQNEVLELQPGRGVVIGRLQAGPLPDPATALMLLAHMDVVGVDAAKWTVDPFAGTVRDGYVYGRGAIDDKGMLATNLATVVGLKRAGARLSRDVIFVGSDDEEGGGPANIKVLIEKYWDKIACGFAINEGGRTVLKDGKTQYVAIQASEKISYNVGMIATGVSGHASMPRPDNPVVHLAAAVAKVGTYQAPAQPTTITRRYFEQLAAIEDEDTGKWIRALEQPERAELAAKRISEMSPLWNSMLRDSIAPTILKAGFRGNIIPSDATANLNIRLLPGHSMSDLIAQLTKLVNDPQVRFQVGEDNGENAPPSDIEGTLFKTIERVTPKDFPGAAVLPFLSTVGTDSAQLRLHKVQAYGIIPFPLTDADDARMHADDERIPIESFRKGVAFLYHVVSEFAGSK
jgi:acetylornithine deacetylase/succinyl-diaminopimelate desuccinylase-like protein